MAEVHAHKVLDLLRETPMTKAVLKEKVLQVFGVEVLFRTCKQRNFDIDSLLVFFENNQKIIEKSGVWFLNEAQLCSHNH